MLTGDGHIQSEPSLSQRDDFHLPDLLIDVDRVEDWHERSSSRVTQVVVERLPVGCADDLDLSMVRRGTKAMLQHQAMVDEESQKLIFNCNELLELLRLDSGDHRQADWLVHVASPSGVREPSAIVTWAESTQVSLRTTSPSSSSVTVSVS